MSILQHTLHENSVKVGRFITSVDQVSQNHHDPLSTSKQSVLSHTDDYRTASNPSFVSTLKSLLSTLFERTELKIRMTPERIDTRTLKDPNRWLNEVIHLPATQAWLKKAFKRYNHIYIIVSVHAATNARIQVDLRYKKTGRLRGRSDYVASGEQIYAFEYCEIYRGGLLNMDFNKCRLAGGLLLVALDGEACCKDGRWFISNSSGRSAWGNFILGQSPEWDLYTSENPVMYNFNTTGGESSLYTISNYTSVINAGDVKLMSSGKC